MWIQRAMWMLLAVGVGACSPPEPAPQSLEPRARNELNTHRPLGEADAAGPAGDQGAEGAEASRFVVARQRMVEQQIRKRGIRDERLLDVFMRVPRHEFVPDEYRAAAYDDTPLPIGFGQTISQPYIVAYMTELVQPQNSHRALDIGTGCGYQAAILAELVDSVYSIEIVEPLAEAARVRLDALGYRNVEIRAGDGYQGWAEHAPFDVIVVAAAPDHVPQPLVDQLAPNGRLVIPVGRQYQQLLLIEKLPNGTTRETRVAPVAFVPMTGEAEDRQ